MQVHPAGTAPEEDSFKPQTGADVVDYDERDKSAQPSALDGIPGATSQDVNTGMGKAPSGVLGQEEHNLRKKRKKEKGGLVGTAGGAHDLNRATREKDAQELRRQLEGKEDVIKGPDVFRK